MKKQILITTLSLLLYFSVSGQNYIYRGENQYESTSTWQFSLNANYWTSNPEITIAKNNTGGYLMISIVVPFNNDSIKGNLTIILDDGTMIKCIDKGLKDYVDNTSTKLYNLTMAEIEKMKISKINKIRFNIYRDNGNYIKGEYLPFTASNIKSSRFLTYPSNEEKKYYETDVEIANLFEE